MLNKLFMMIISMCLSASVFASTLTVENPILFKIQSQNYSTFKWFITLDVSASAGRSSAACASGAPNCPIYLQMLKGTASTIQLRKFLGSTVYCQITITNVDNQFFAKLAPVANSPLSCSLSGNPNNKDFLLTIRNQGEER